MTSSNPHLILGLDIGIGSCGWCLLDTKQQTAIKMGVRLWDPPQEPKTKLSLAATRRQARSSRRNTKRTHDRKKHCFEILLNEGLVPSGSDISWIQTKKGDKPTLRLRVAALNRLLSDREWAQVLYSLCSRRGYIPHGEGSDDVDGKKVLSAIDDQKKAMEESGYKTIGELLSNQPRSRNQGGDYSLCVSHEQLVAEVKTLFDIQDSLGSDHASREFLSKYLECMSWQKDSSDHDETVYKQVGYCVYFPSEKRAASSCLSSEMCKAYERINHIIIVGYDGKESKLSYETKRKTIDTLFSANPLPRNKSCKVKYSDLRKWEDLEPDAYFKGIDKDKEKSTEPFIPSCWRSQRDKLPKGLLTKMREDLDLADEIDSALTYATSEKSLKEKLGHLDLSQEEIDSICSLSYTSRLYSGYGSRSLKALSLLIDSFEDENITTLTDAERESGLLGLRLDKLEAKNEYLPAYQVFDKTCNNPVVLRTMGQVRKTINAVIKKHGLPDEIHVELARELKHSAKEKKQISKANNETRKRRDILRKNLSEDLGCPEEHIPTSLLFKVELYEEQKKVDIYSGAKISYERLIHEDHYCEIDHILPYSRTGMDGRMNKVLVLQESNQNKREQTPYEWLSKEGRWDEFKLRVLRLEHYPQKKKQNLLNTDLEGKENEFLARNLNDTRYASRSTMQFIEKYLAFPEDGKRHVYAVAGGATATLRNAWGLRKVREEDNLHHAIDAAVIAACDQSRVIKVAKLSETKWRIPKEDRKKAFEGTEPWEGFASEIIEMKGKIIPSRMIDHKISGRLYEDTLYHFDGYDEKGQKGILSAKGKTVKSSNYVIDEHNVAKIVDGLAFLRLWWNPEAKVRGRKERGEFLPEPVYYADLPKALDDDYIPKICPRQTDKKPREKWDQLSEKLRQQQPVILFRNDAIMINGDVRRFTGFDISACAWALADPTGRMDDREATKGHALSSAVPGVTFRVIQEDVLGECFESVQNSKVI